MARLNPIADAMSAIKNAGDAGRSEVIVEPASKVLGSMLRVMQENGFIGGFEFIDDGRGGQFRVQLTGTINKCGAITPRFSVTMADMEYWESQYLPAKNFGILIVSTSRGVLSHEQARNEGIGGQLLGYVY
ncbi:MAG TPA: 30S ribosomal protein S8 [Candidatus Methanoculleus thermohydrogenotrophicum]|jgi:small subunit ribosomal protein S8|nr:30S ribosomal protein S8 [Candidatus Methanoculleus thermohydrogenotrophicum]NLM81699.1 30S ribosomal protein S8 [Candidatus Methanoculleus thermohydrogenotrophicum]HOB17839.1 30S ribosomal protein S8 [Candidatus Methanoculleus thermohydrogenotrophicum]HPZ37390.1 30S ribosomal protein S8 [Candidatus Methanoculleus thermohydrogenotrophicum]HQC91262.1 30S ribosomal protein S8 [Candidatus Methanoculleus thermohydrogenotrophicum]